MEQIKNILKEELLLIEKNIASLIEAENCILSELESFISGPSKRIRSVLALLYLKSQNMCVTDEVIDLLTAGELFHNASLLHDDVIDNSELRRGETTIGKKFSDKISVLSGDLLISFGIKKILKIKNSMIQDTFLNCTQVMCKAEIQQFLNRGQPVKLDEYIDICSGKTAALFEAILMSCAVLTGSNVDIAKRFAHLFGIIFQIKNDLNPISAKNDKQNKVYTINDIFSIEKTNNLMDNYKQEMRSIIKNFPENEYKKGLEALTENI